jgi:prepilin-type N-terminal cleavage/methylation domain-containing protein
MRVKKLQLSNFNQHGFTLVELIIVIGILAVLSSMAIGEFYHRRRVAYDRQAIAVAKNLLSLAVTAFANDEIPTLEGLSVGTSPKGYPELDTTVTMHTYIDKDYDGANAWSFYIASEGGNTAYFFWLPGDNCALTTVKGAPSDTLIENVEWNVLFDPDENWRADPNLAIP